MEPSFNGSFTVISYRKNIFYPRQYLFLKREQDELWDLPGGGFSINETNYKQIARREVREETTLLIKIKKLKLIAILGQVLRSDLIKQYGVRHGFVFVTYTKLQKTPKICLSSEHTDYHFFTRQEIFSQYKKFKSGPLWIFFTYLKFQKTGKIQEGMVRDHRFWQGQEYL